jgi:hypothetical protein
MLVGFKLFVFGGLIVVGLLFAALKAAYDFLVALLKRRDAQAGKVL